MLTDEIINCLLALYPAALGTIARRYTVVAGGLSGAMVLLVDVNAAPEAPKAYNGKAFAKIDTVEHIQQEYARHEAARVGMESFIPDVIHPPLEQCEGYSLLLLSPGQQVVVEAQSLAGILKDYLENRHGTEAIRAQVHLLVTESLQAWQPLPDFIQQRQGRTASELLIQLLNRGGEDRLGDLAARYRAYFGLEATFEQVTFIAHTNSANNTITLPNPLHFALQPGVLPLLHIAGTPARRGG